MEQREHLLEELQAETVRLQGRLSRSRQSSDRYTRVRLASFGVGGIISAATLLTSGVVPWFVVSIIALIPFVVSVRRHRHVEESIVWDELLLKLKHTQVARMNLDWSGIPDALEIPRDPDHPFAGDLDLSGPSSVHQLLDTAISLEGSVRLHEWLLSTDPYNALILERQASIRELVTLASFRDELLLNAAHAVADSGGRWPGKRLLEWLGTPTGTGPRRLILQILVPLSLVNIVLAILNATGVLPPVWIISWLVYVAVSASQLRENRSLFQDAFYLRDSLLRLVSIFGYLETFDYGHAPMLRRLCAPFLHQTKRPSLQLKKVVRVVAAIGLQKNPVLWAWLNALVPWDISAAYQLNRTKKALVDLLPTWLDIWFELEALSSMANFAYLNPCSTFPSLEPDADDGEPDALVAAGIGHPLIAAEQRIYNDFTIPTRGSIHILTGSNMAGKSTFLRTLGVNLALAYAGGPVIAQSLRAPRFRIFTAIRVTDSVVDGFSYFYAEVRRLSTLLGQLKQFEELPLFFLIDEIFRGTNNRERLIGSRAYVRELANGNGSGIIATHDLELVGLEEEISEVRNYHFRDDVEDGRMIFDYKLHPGPCPTTNALRIMRLAGLPITNDP